MQTLACQDNTGSPVARLAFQPLWLWWLAAFTLIALRQWLTAGAGLSDYLGDMDDAARLVQVRELLAGKSWFDLWTARMGGEPGMLWHWSRLIDAPIALQLAAFRVVLPAETAELATRAIWPLLVLAPLLYVMARAADNISGRPAALITLALAAMCPLGLYQFAAGRIDQCGLGSVRGHFDIDGRRLARPRDGGPRFAALHRHLCVITALIECGACEAGQVIGGDLKGREGRSAAAGFTCQSKRVGAGGVVAKRLLGRCRRTKLSKKELLTLIPRALRPHFHQTFCDWPRRSAPSSTSTPTAAKMGP